MFSFCPLSVYILQTQFIVLYYLCVCVVIHEKIKSPASAAAFRPIFLRSRVSPRHPQMGVLVRTPPPPGCTPVHILLVYLSQWGTFLIDYSGVFSGCDMTNAG